MRRWSRSNRPVTSFDERTGKKKKEKVVRTVHDIYDEAGDVVGEKLFDLRQESTGTLRFLAYIQNVIEMISNGGCSLWMKCLQGYIRY